MDEPPTGPAAPALRVRVRLFAMQRELVGAREIVLALAPGSVVEDAWAALVALHPGLRPGRSAVRFALDGEYVEPTAGLADGGELAVVPPVSGGDPNAGPEHAADPRPGGDRILEIRPTPFGPEIIAELSHRLARPEDGAVVGFLGRTRSTPGTPAPGQEADAERFAGEVVASLEYEAHETMAVRILDQIADEIAARFGVERLAIVHRAGDVPLGAISVAVVACAPHRDAAFAAARYAIDETKARAPIWKAERFEGGHVWIGAPARSGPPEPEGPGGRAG